MTKPKPRSQWLHTNGNTYTVICVANEYSERDDYPPTVVYYGPEGTIFAKPLSEWHHSRTLLPTKGPFPTFQEDGLE